MKRKEKKRKDEKKNIYIYPNSHVQSELIQNPDEQFTRIKF